MLSPEEREGMVAEATSSRRRDMLARARQASYGTMALTAYLSFLSSTSAFLAPRATLPRRRLRPGGRFLL